MADPTTLEQRTAALQCLIGAKRALGMNAEACALWLAERAHEIAPDLFKVTEDLARVECEWGGRAGGLMTGGVRRRSERIDALFC